VIIIEPQGRDDETKAYSWPAYLANVRSAVKCKTAVLIVICPDAREAEKCRQVIEMGHPGWNLWPLVIDPGHPPADDGTSPYLTLFLATLPAIDMEAEEGARRVLAAIRDTGASASDRKALSTIILKRASAGARKTLEALMAATEWKDDFIESYVNAGLEKGMKQGIEQGIEKGIEQGIEQGAVKAGGAHLVKLLESRKLGPTQQQLGRVTECTDAEQLDLWFDRALTAATADEVFRD
jgi:hypothetical protein